MFRNLLFILTFPLCAQQVERIDTISHWNTTSINGITCDPSGNVIVAGNYGGGYNKWGGGYYIRKYSPSGTLIWKDSAYAYFRAHCTGIVSDQSGNSYVTAYLQGQNDSIHIGGTKYKGGWCIYLVKYSSTGQILWIKRQENGSAPYVISIDKNEKIHISGAWSSGGFITKYDVNGNCLDTIITDQAYDMGQDTMLNTYVYTTQPSVNAPMYFRKFDSTGNQVWALQGPSAKFAIDKKGNSYFSSQGSSNATSPLEKMSSYHFLQWSISVPFWGGYALHTDRYDDVYVAGYNHTNAVIEKYDPLSSLVWHLDLPLGGPSAIFTYSNTVYLAINRGNTYYSAGYLYKITQPAISGVHESINQESLVNIFPNPSSYEFTINYKGTDNSPVYIKVHDASGKLIKEQKYSNFSQEFRETLDLHNCPQGVYFLEIRCGLMRETKKIIVQ